MIRLLVAVVSGAGCYFAATAGASQVAIGLAVIAVILLGHVVLTNRDLVLHILQMALLGGTAFTGVALAIAISRDNVAGAALYALLLVLCVVGLLIKPADKRTAA